MLFVHDHTFMKKDEQYYTSGSLNNKVFKRYINWFGNVSVLANERIANDKDERFICEQNKVDCVHFNLVKKTNNILSIIKKRSTVKQIVSEHDCIVVRLPSVYGMMAIHYASKLDKPYLVEVVGCPWDAYWNHSIKGKVFAPIMWFLTRESVKHSGYTLYVSNQFLQHRYPSKGKTIGCSDVLLSPFDESILETRLNKINHMSKEKSIVLGTVAAVNVRYKGQQYVIRAISRLNKEGCNFKYHLAGGGDNTYLKKVAQQYNVTDKVKFLGPLPHEQVFEFMKNIDIYIQPSNAESHGRVIVEAMSKACPCIGSNAGGIPELLNDKFIFKKASVNEICELLKNADNNVMIEEAKRSFEKAKEYDKELLDKKRSSFYNEFLGNSVSVKNESNNMDKIYREQD